MPVGNEGAGVVIAAGDLPAAQALLGRTVAIMGGAMYAQYRTIRAAACLVLPEDTTAAEGASCFVNPLTSLSMVETMRREGHAALVHTAAASNLGQMLNKVCLEDGVGLVNIVRSPEQLRALTADRRGPCLQFHRPNLHDRSDRGAGGDRREHGLRRYRRGGVASEILTAMEAAANHGVAGYVGYGSSVYKQVYIYGALDPCCAELTRNFGMTWGVGGWLLSPFLAKIGSVRARELRNRVASSLKSTFASHYAGDISLFEALDPRVIAAYRGVATGAKYVINPSKAR